jgi:glycosyltransferase involved in cell wall biosynthesis
MRQLYFSLKKILLPPVNFLLPVGTRRRHWFSLGVKIVRILANEGFRGVLHRIKIRWKRPVDFSIKPHDFSKVYAQMIDTALGNRGSEYISLADNDVSTLQPLAKLIAFYLPQFHPIPENDQWWGRGFTEWTNVSKAVPNFMGHYQPHLPGELGFYDLRLPEVQKRQVELAKKYGIYGFCYYYYWFAGKRLLERPLDQYLANPHLDLPYCLCWANENWTRRWDGAEQEILIAQEYTEEQYLHFIKDISLYFADPRYIRIAGMPVLLVYRVNLIPDAQKAAETWRNECRKMGIGEIFLVAVQSFGITDPRPFGFDAAVEFPPSNLGEALINRNSVKLTNQNFRGGIFDYNIAAQVMLEKKHEGYTAFKTVFPSWDNTARRQNDAHIFINSSPKAYGNWLSKVVRYTTQNLPEDRRFIFINAWNEWAEGTHLEPDRFHGYAYLQTTAEAITRGKFRSNSTSNWTILFVSHDAHKGGAQTVLLNTIAWFKEHTTISIKILCLERGDLLPQFQELGHTILLSDLQQMDAISSKGDLTDRLLDALDYELPDLIYGNTVVAGKAYQWLSKLKVPILTHIHEMDSSIQYYCADSIEDVLKYSSHFLACSRAVQDNLIRNHGVSVDKISIGHASIYKDPGLKRLNINEKNRQKKKLGLVQNKHLIFGCGIGMPFRKGADLFIELGQILRRKGRNDFHLYWIGGFEKSASDGKYAVWSDYLKRLEQSDVRNYITFLGYKKNSRDYLQVGDVYVMTSREEPFGLVALEAADCEVPTICFDNAGAADFVGEDAGFIVPFEDLEAMAQKLIFLMENENLGESLGIQAKEKFLDAFTVERTTPHILSTCRKLADKKPAVSIIVPNYNHAQYLPQRLESIFNQTYQDFEVILLDDFSLDNSLEIFKKYAHWGDVKIVKNDRNSGSPFRQWLRGIDLAKADIWWIAESDDISDPSFLETLLPAFNYSNVKLAYSNSHVIDEKSVMLGDYLSSDYLTALSRIRWSTSYRISAEQEVNDALGVKDTILNVSAVLFRRYEMDPLVRSTLNEMRSSGDWYFIIQVIKGGEVYYDARKLNYHRRHSESVIGKILKSNKVENFYQEMSIVHRTVAENYNLSTTYYEKWDQYLRDQWYQFFNDRPFDDLRIYYPIDDNREKIKRRIFDGGL